MMPVYPRKLPVSNSSAAPEHPRWPIPSSPCRYWEAWCHFRPPCLGRYSALCLGHGPWDRLRDPAQGSLPLRSPLWFSSPQWLPPLRPSKSPPIASLCFPRSVSLLPGRSESGSLTSGTSRAWHGWTPTSVTNGTAEGHAHILSDSVPFAFLFPGGAGGVATGTVCLLSSSSPAGLQLRSRQEADTTAQCACAARARPLPPSGPRSALVTRISHRSSDDVCHQACRGLQPSITSCPGNTSRVIGQTHAQGVSCPSHQGPPRGQ